MHPSLFLYALHTVPGVGAKTLRQLVGVFGSAEAAWEASEVEWQTLPDVGPKTIAAWQKARQTFDWQQAEATLAQDGIQLVSFLEPDFPSLLAETPHPPALLYVRGDPAAWRCQPLIAMVGSRQFTAYGKQVAGELAQALARAGFTVVSGLAFGIDAAAHEATLEAGGLTLAVLGSGNDAASLSPQSHAGLATRILESGGAIYSELPPGTPGTAGTFPARNRIMAGMTLGTIVVEAAEDSGSLITARLALDYNREVFAVPGSIFSPMSAGTHALIRSGAKIVTGINDILEELAPHLPRQTTEDQPPPTDLSPEEQRLLKILSHEPLHIDKIIEASRLETMSANSFLTRLEMHGLAKNIGNMHYVRLKH